MPPSALVTTFRLCCSVSVFQQFNDTETEDRHRPNDRDKAAATVSRTSSHSPLIGGVCPHRNTAEGRSWGGARNSFGSNNEEEELHNCGRGPEYISSSSSER